MIKEKWRNTLVWVKVLLFYTFCYKQWCVSGSAAFKELQPKQQRKQKLKLRLHQLRMFLQI